MWENISFVFDFILLFGGFLAMRYAKMIGGSIGHNSLNYMTAGFFLLGIAHLSETLLIVTVPADHAMMETLHRLIVFLAFVLLIVGYRRLAKFVNS